MANFLDLIAGEGETVMFIKSLVDTTLSAGSILSKLSDAGLGIRRQTGLQVINYLRNTVAPSRSYVSYLTLNSLPSISRIPASLTDQLRNFTYHVVLSGFSSLTGELVTSNVNIKTNNLLTKQQALDLAIAIGESDSKSGGLNGASGQVTGITQNSAGLVTP